MAVSRLLRYALIADAFATAATSLMMIAFGGDLAGWLGIPAAFQRYLGLGLLPYAAIVGYLGSRTHVGTSAVWTVIVCNVLWAIASVAALLTGLLPLTSLGIGFVIAQALIVAGLAELQWFGMRRAAAVPVGYAATV